MLAFIGSSVPVVGQPRLVGKFLSLGASGRSKFYTAAVKRSSKSVLKLISVVCLIQASHLAVIQAATDPGSVRVQNFLERANLQQRREKSQTIFIVYYDVSFTLTSPRQQFLPRQNDRRQSFLPQLFNR
jgi:hypothetical protein